MSDWRDRHAFIGFPYRLLRDDPLWAPPLRFEERARLSPKNPFFQHARADHFIARRGKRVVGRISAIENRLHNELYQDRLGFFGFFDAVDDLDVASALVEAAADRLRRAGLRALRGPTNLSTNEEVGVLIEGFDHPSCLMMPHNPPYYGRLLESAGLRKAKDLVVYETGRRSLPERLARAADRLAKRYQLRLRTLDRNRFWDEVKRIQRLYNRSWERNWGFVPMTNAEIEALARRLRPIVVPELVAFAEHDSEPIGFGMALPDLNVAFRANRRGWLLPGLLRLWRAQRRIDRMRVLLLGVTPAWRSKGVDALLYKTIWERAVAKGFRWAEAGWILEDNLPMRNALERFGFERYKSYRLYDGSL